MDKKVVRELLEKQELDKSERKQLAFAIKEALEGFYTVKVL
jgi:ribosomal protein S6